MRDEEDNVEGGVPTVAKWPSSYPSSSLESCVSSGKRVSLRVFWPLIWKMREVAPPHLGLLEEENQAVRMKSRHT
jgi:hypothetical protein